MALKIAKSNVARSVTKTATLTFHYTSRKHGEINLIFCSLDDLNNFSKKFKACTEGKPTGIGKSFEI